MGLYSEDIMLHAVIDGWVVSWWGQEGKAYRRGNVGGIECEAFRPSLDEAFDLIKELRAAIAPA